MVLYLIECLQKRHLGCLSIPSNSEGKHFEWKSGIRTYNDLAGIREKCRSILLLTFTCLCITKPLLINF